MRDWTFVGFGTVAAELYDLGPYPGAVPSGDPRARVEGEVYRLAAIDALARLDEHEGEEFARRRVDVTLASGDVESAWIYWYRLEPRGGRITSGDYLDRGRPELRR